MLCMLSKFVGEEKFLKGVSLYLKKHLYLNTVSCNLWEGISEATGMLVPVAPVSIVDKGCTKELDIPKIMDNWVSKVRGCACWIMIQTPIILYTDGVPCAHCHRDSNLPKTCRAKGH